MHSALHVHANDPMPDMAAFTYAILRMPDCLHEVKLVLMGQSARVFRHHGFDDVETWQPVSAPGRRRRSFFDGESTLALYIASRSDIDDIIPILTAYQIEREKLQRLMNMPGVRALLNRIIDLNDDPYASDLHSLSEMTGISVEDLGRVSQIWGKATGTRLLEIADHEQEIAIRSLAGTLIDYKRATRRWWQNVESKVADIRFAERPIYFISSNTHSLTNMLTGFASSIEDELHSFIHASGSEALNREYRDILESNVPSSRENFLYYTLKKYEAEVPDVKQRRISAETELGIWRVPSKHAFDIEVQVVELAKLDPDKLDSRLHMDNLDALRQSDALIVNIDYPLGFAAYQVLIELSRNVAEVLGVYIMGKAATLNGRIGDVMIPSVVHDEHSLNTYLFKNEFSANDVAPYLVYSTVMDNQKAITVPGTFLQNEGYMSLFYKEGYTDMEMEAGPYLSAIYEMSRPKRHPYNEIVNIHAINFPVGVLHYASDTPFSKGKNLGAQNLSYFGMDSTYATTIAITRAILSQDVQRLTPSGETTS